METTKEKSVKANQVIIDCMVESVSILNKVSDIDSEVFGETSNIDSLVEAHQRFYDELKKELIKILDGDIYNERR